MTSLLDALQLPLEKVHGEDLVLVAAGWPSADAGQRPEHPPGSLLNEPLRVVRDVRDGEGGGEAAVHGDHEHEHGDQVQEDDDRGPCGQPPRLLLVLVIVRVLRGLMLHCRVTRVCIIILLSEIRTRLRA